MTLFEVVIVTCFGRGVEKIQQIQMFYNLFKISSVEIKNHDSEIFERKSKTRQKAKED